MEKLTVEWAGYTFLEPMALLLNWLLMAQSLYYYRKLKSYRASNFSIFWRWFFLLFAISTFFGGISHFLFGYLGLTGKIPGWLAGIFAITFMELAMSSTLEKEWRSRLQIVSIVKLAITGIMLLISFDFNTVLLHSTGMAFFTIPPMIYMLKQGKPDINYVIFGVLALLASLPFRIFGVDFHQLMNRDDIGHLLMIVALLCFFKGVKYRESRLPNFQVASS
ncbi:MAG: putative membrane protein [Cyclobacteriaceae bacterium]|jgi:uncharacterized membrane protein